CAKCSWKSATRKARTVCESKNAAFGGWFVIGATHRKPLALTQLIPPWVTTLVEAARRRRARVPRSGPQQLDPWRCSLRYAKLLGFVVHRCQNAEVIRSRIVSGDDFLALTVQRRNCRESNRRNSLAKPC